MKWNAARSHKWGISARQSTNATRAPGNFAVDSVLLLFSPRTGLGPTRPSSGLRQIEYFPKPQDFVSLFPDVGRMDISSGRHVGSPNGMAASSEKPSASAHSPTRV